MATATEPARIDADLDDEIDPGPKPYHEIVDGQPVEKMIGVESDLIASTLIALIRAHVHDRHKFCFGSSCGYQSIFPHDPKRVRFPDVSFVRYGRLPDDKLPRGNMRIAPDLVVEVISPDDKAEVVEQRLTDFLRAGVPLAWIIYPLTKQAYVFHQGPAASRLGLGDVLDGEEVLPGFRCPLDDLFAGI